MQLRNMSARLVTINVPNGDSIQIKPGDNPAVDVPEEALELPFVKHLLDARVLVQEVPRYADVDEDGDVDEDDEELAQLQAEALSLGMDFKESWKASTLKRKISEFKKD